MATGGTDFIALDAARSATEDDNLHRLGVPDTDGNTGPPGGPTGPVGRSSVRIAAATVRPPAGRSVGPMYVVHTLWTMMWTSRGEEPRRCR